MAANAPCGVVILGDLHKDTQNGFWVQDCAACTHTLLLAAHGKGLGAVWTGIYPIKQRVEKFRVLLDAPQSAVPFSMVLLGHSDQRPGEATQKMARNDVFFNAFGNRSIPS